MGSAFASNEVVLENLLTEAIAEDVAPCTQWVTVNRSCGGQFYLCKDNYATDEDLMRAVIHYDAVQCKTLQPSDPGTGG